jgi:hypothetical protein
MGIKKESSCKQRFSGKQCIGKRDHDAVALVRPEQTR